MIKIDKKYLPSKNFQIALSIAISIILIVVIFNIVKPLFSKKQSGLLINSNTTSALNSVDSDNDNLFDWKEVLYGTDPKNSDSDNDGTKDGEEIIENRDPLKANTATKGEEPNDKIELATIEENKKILAEYESLNATEKMARDLMSSFFASQPANGQALDQNTINSIVNQTLRDLPERDYDGITKESDLNLITINPKTFSSDLLTYAKGYYTQTEAYRKIVGQDLDLINVSITTGKSQKTNIAKITSQYQTIINNLIKLPLPATPGSSGSRFHLALINNFEKLIKIDNDTISDNASKDTASVFSDLSAYNDTVKQLMMVLNTLDIVLKINRPTN